MIEVGAKGRFEVEVTKENTARAMKSGELEVFATPALVAACEAAAVDAVKDSLASEDTTVGTLMHLEHTAPSAVGERIVAEAELTAVEGRQLIFRVCASDGVGVVGTGEHRRFIVNKTKFIKKANTRGDSIVK